MSILGDGAAKTATECLRRRIVEMLAELNHDPSRDAADCLKELRELCDKQIKEIESGWW